MEIRPEPGWKGLSKKLKGRTTVFIGRAGAGKTTLVRYVIRELISAGEAVSLVDSDIGQSSLGPPGTVSMKTLGKVEDVADFKPGKMIFIGVTNPALRISLLVEAVGKLVHAAKRESARTMLVDTTGLVAGGLGRALKLAKMRAVRPDNVVAVERTDELEHILERLDSIKVYRLRASRFAKEKTQVARARYRRERYSGYFKDSRAIAIRADKMELRSVDGRPMDSSEVDIGMLVALNRGEDTRALGIVSAVEGYSMQVKTPIESLNGINTIVIGDIRLEQLLVEQEIL